MKELLLNSDITDTGGFLLRISLAIILGAIIGLERQLTRHNAVIIKSGYLSISLYHNNSSMSTFYNILIN